MEKNEYYKVIITNENGEMVNEFKSDCIVAAASDLRFNGSDKKAINGIYYTNCDAITIAEAFKSIDKIKEEAFDSNQSLSIAMKLDELVKNVFAEAMKK